MTREQVGKQKPVVVSLQNCSQRNAWDKDEQLAQLCGTLEKEAAQVPWDTSPEKVASVHKLIRTLKQRFRGVSQADKYRTEVKRRQRKAGRRTAANTTFRH